MFNFQCQTAALDELFGNPRECFRRYQTAQILLHSLAQQSKNSRDKESLNKCKIFVIGAPFSRLPTSIKFAPFSRLPTSMKFAPFSRLPTSIKFVTLGAFQSKARKFSKCLLSLQLKSLIRTKGRVQLSCSAAYWYLYITRLNPLSADYSQLYLIVT